MQSTVLLADPSGLNESVITSPPSWVLSSSGEPGGDDPTVIDDHQRGQSRSASSI